MLLLLRRPGRMPWCSAHSRMYVNCWQQRTDAGNKDQVAFNIYDTVISPQRVLSSNYKNSIDLGSGGALRSPDSQVLMTCNQNIPLKRHYRQTIRSRRSCIPNTLYIHLQTRRNKYNKWCLRDSTSAMRMRKVIQPTRDVHIRDWVQVQLRFVRMGWYFHLMLCCTLLEPGINTVFGLLHAGWPVESDAVTETYCYGSHVPATPD